MYQTVDNVVPLSNLEMQIKNKIAYEWKNIYRSLAQFDDGDGQIQAREF
jgi:hypothetical protein